MAVRARYSVPIITWLAGAFLVAVFLTGGGARPDVASLVVLRPLAAFAGVLFLAHLSRAEWRTLRVPAAIAGAAVAITLIQLVPMPPALWSKLPGREIIVEATRAAGIEQGWRPLSIAPWRTVNALMSWLVPIAAAAAAAAGGTTHRHRLLPVLIGIGLVSGFLSILQIAGPPDSSLYFYRITSTGEAVGLFANRNHNALLLAALFPMLAAYACAGVRSGGQHRVQLGLAIAAGAALVPLILVVGSRAGLVLLGVGIASTLFVYHSPAGEPAKRLRWRLNPATIGLAGGFAALALACFFLARAASFDRLADTDVRTEVRLQIWERTWSLAQAYFPTGAGFGTFVESYQLDEPRELLRLTYANHAHNDWLEVLVGGGVPGALLLLAAVVAWAAASWRLWRQRADASRDQALGRAGSVILLMVAIGSVFDYPARVPSIAALLAIASVWMAYAVGGAGRDASSPRR